MAAQPIFVLLVLDGLLQTLNYIPRLLIAFSPRRCMVTVSLISTVLVLDARGNFEICQGDGRRSQGDGQRGCQRDQRGSHER